MRILLRSTTMADVNVTGDGGEVVVQPTTESRKLKAPPAIA
jgi:hypothetical protein